MTDSELRAATELEKRQTAEREAVRVETNAMGMAFSSLQPLGEEARTRAIRWLAQALNLRRAYDGDVPF